LDQKKFILVPLTPLTSFRMERLGHLVGLRKSFNVSQGPPKEDLTHTGTEIFKKK
jgi:hypothetical protein